VENSKKSLSNAFFLIIRFCLNAVIDIVKGRFDEKDKFRSMDKIALLEMAVLQDVISNIDFHEII
jgi:hypothetical protein